MSWLALDWAETAPVADVYERVILTQMAGRADKDGTGVYLSPATLARRAVSDEQTIKRRLRALRERGVIAYGDQSLAAKIPVHRRPKVYDLMIPASFYSERQLDDLNRIRAENGLEPITPGNRPDLPDVAPSRKTRSDTGVSKPARTAPTGEDQPLTWSDSEGGLVDPSTGGGSARPGVGGLVDPGRGVYETPKTFSKKPSEEDVKSEPPLRSGSRTPADAAIDALFDPAPVDEGKEVATRAAIVKAERRSRRAARTPAALNATAHSSTARRLVNAYAETCTVPPAGRLYTQYCVEVTRLLQADYPEDVIAQAMIDAGEKGYGPASLQSFAHSVANRSRSPRRSTGDQRTIDAFHAIDRVTAARRGEAPPPSSRVSTGDQRTADAFAAFDRVAAIRGANTPPHHPTSAAPADIIEGEVVR